MTALAEDFAALFEGRKDAWGLDYGGSQRGVLDSDWWNPPDDLWRRHLDGDVLIGVYPMVPGIFRHGGEWIGPERGGLRDAEVSDLCWSVKWGCVDLDVKGPTHATGYDNIVDAFHAAYNLEQVLRLFKVTSWIEQTRSGGFHVWVFANTWVPAATMRRALLVACEAADVPPTEVNPKAEGYDDPDMLGNYVRLPYPGGVPDAKGYRSMLSNITPEAPAWETLTLYEFVTRATASRTNETILSSLADLWVPPVASADRIVLGDPVDLDEPLRKRLGGLAFTILTDGPLEGGDRSGTLFKLACCCAADGLTADEALAVVTAADERWGKYSTRHDAERYLTQTVTRAYQGAP